MRRPPDKDGHASSMADRDVVSSNATLNAFLGGGSRQKPWMVAGLGGTPVRPTPRPNIPRPLDQNLPDIQRNSITTTTTTTPILTTSQPTTSNKELSPVLAQTSVLSNVQFNPVSPTHAEPTSSEYQLGNDSSAEGVGTASLEVYNTTADADVGIALPQAFLSPTGGSTQALGVESTTFARIHTPQQLEQQARVLPASMPPAQNSPLVANQNLRYSAISSPLEFLDAPSMSAAPHQTPSISQPPPRRSRTLPPTMPPLKNRIPLLKSHIEQSGGMDNLNSALEKPRFNLLEGACNNEDAFYVALHQLFCAWEVTRWDVTTIEGLPNASLLSHAFRILGQLIRDNEGLGPAHLRWFAAFPSPLGDLMTNSEPYRRVIYQAGYFLGKLAGEWADFTKKCVNRGFPPLVDELVNQLGLLSPTLQNIVFTAMRRNLGFVDDEYGNDMERVFLQDRTGHMELASRFNTSRPPASKEIHERNKFIADRYIEISHKRRHNRSQPDQALNNFVPQSATTHSLGSNGTAQPAISSVDLSNNYNNGPGTLPMPSTMDRNQMNSNRPGSGQLQNSAASAAPSAMTITAMNAAAGNRVNTSNNTPLHTSTPSPIQFQGLSMQSPVQPAFTWSSPVLRSNSLPSPIDASNAANHHVPNAGYPPTSYAPGRPSIDPRQPTFYQQQYVSPHYQQLHAQQRQQQSPRPIQPQHIQPPQQLTPQQLQHQLQVQQQIQMQAVQFQMQQQQQQQMQHVRPQQQHQQQGFSPRVPEQGLPLNRSAHPGRDINPNLNLQHQIHSRNNSSSGSNHASPLMSNGVLQSRAQPIHSMNMQRPMTMQEHCHRYGLTDPLQRPIIPPAGYTHRAQLPDPDRTALHQAKIRSPRLVPIDITDMSVSSTRPRYYQYVKGFALFPTKIPFERVLSKFNFNIPQDSMYDIAKDKICDTNILPVREVRSGTLQLRVRCLQRVKDSIECEVSDWVISETAFDNMMFLEINSNALEIRRKAHHGKDLPIDITPYVIAGNNLLSVAIPRSKAVPKVKEQFIAVEVVEILRHDEIMNMCQHQSISATKVLEGIKKSLAGPADNHDDEIEMVASDLSIDLADPFMAKIFDIPVRGMFCLHRECFDLATFLLTRNSKPKRPQQPSMVDVWKCPLCGADARPSSLLTDEFLVSVRKELEKQDKLDVKAILVATDGTWRPKPEPIPAHQKRKSQSGVDDDGDSIDEDRTRKKRSTSAVGEPSAPNNTVEIIELDDD